MTPTLLLRWAIAAVALCTCTTVLADAPRPNIIVIFTDDQGYGDLGCYGATDFHTPRIDQMARQGMRFTNAYAQIVCGPSRSALLTGRQPVRSHGWSMPASEITLAELLQEAGYRTACIGKWDVSNRAAIEGRVPNDQGFDYFWGTLGANDSAKMVLYENAQQIGRTDDMASLSRRYTDKAIGFVEENSQQPFFLYLAHTMVHSVIDASEGFKGTSRGGLYGDTIQELDYHVGRLLDCLDDLELTEQTLVLFVSDNGPWSNLQKRLRQLHDDQIAWGSSGPLRSAKGSTYEGGIRVPCIARWPGRVPDGETSDAMFATIDLLPTLCGLAGAAVPDDRCIDGVDQRELLLGESPMGARNHFHYFCRGEMHAYRSGNWKVFLPDRNEFYPYVKDRGTGGVELYDLEADIGESNNLADQHPEIVQQLMQEAREYEMPTEPYDPEIYLQR